MNGFVITQFDSLLIAHDPAGRKKHFTNRHSACFILPQKGKIRFSFGENELIAHASQPVFLPQGTSYLNECLEDAESYVINFQTLRNDHCPTTLAPIPPRVASVAYERMRALFCSPSPSHTAQILEAAYALAAQLFAQCEFTPTLHSLVEKALAHMHDQCHRNDLTVLDIAQHCCISEIYLRKLFAKELHCSPFQKLTEIRMKKARLFIKEQYPLKEVIDNVGYSDVFQFSRAYKRYYGFSPTKTKA